MRHIEKSQRQQQGEQIVTEFLDCFHHRTGAYPDDMYNAFSSEIDDAHGHITFRKRLKDEVLNPEQHGLCCYCMRKLSACSKVTIEHVIPNHAADKAEMDLYRKQPTALDPLPHPTEFMLQPHTNPPHPHSIAYQNLLLSCDGDLFRENTKSVCCNLKRNHTFLPPIVLLPDIEQKFIYNKRGWAEWTEDSEPPESKNNAVKILGLNGSVLRMVRRIWFFCNDNQIDPRQEDKVFVVNTMVGYVATPDITEAEVNMLLNFKQDKYWGLLLEYDAFATIEHVV
jgi:hypothetical protein